MDDALSREDAGRVELYVPQSYIGLSGRLGGEMNRHIVSQKDSHTATLDKVT